LYASSIPSRPTISAAVGKSGPLIRSISAARVSSSVASGWSSAQVTPSTTSRRLCGGMLVAIPTAIPDPPLTSRLGMRLGSTSGSVVFPSYVGEKSTVSSSMSRSISMASCVSRDSVYRIAAAGSLPGEPKLP
jgi:hypothetical protein